MSKVRNEGSSKRLLSLVLSLILIGAFAFLFLRSLSTNRGTEAAKGIDASIEEKIKIEAENGKKEGKGKKADDFTFYKTLTAPIKPKFDPKEELLKSKKEEDKPASTVEKAEEGSKSEQAGRIDPEKGSFSVQLGSFVDFKKAEYLKEQLERKGLKPFIVAANLKTDETHYRVRIGRFSNRDDALARSKKIKDEQNLFSIVVGE